MDSYGYRGALYGHFGHGCVHTRINFDLRIDRRASRKFRKFMDEAADLVVSYGGSLSGEHGDGQVAGRTAAEDVRAGTGAGLPRIQGASGIPPGR